MAVWQARQDRQHHTAVQGTPPLPVAPVFTAVNPYSITHPCGVSRRKIANAQQERLTLSLSTIIQINPLLNSVRHALHCPKILIRDTGSP